MSISGGVVAVCGSRSLPVSAGPLVGRVVQALLSGGSSLVVGCASGADGFALSSVMSAGAVSSVSVFAAFGPGGAGAAGSVSAVSVVSAAAAAGVSVSWWAGGSAGVPVQARLSARTRAVVGAASSGLVAFLGSPASPGSFLACRLALARGLPVLVFPVGFHGHSLPLLGPGSWVPVGGNGVWSLAWRWLPDQGILF
jgi:predicted Rossmann fold nucleotide-binding protein DprA/Smf involved in DNA uptake